MSKKIDAAVKERAAADVRRPPAGLCFGHRALAEAVAKKLGVGPSRQVGAFGEVLAEQPVGTLVASSLPGRVWVAEES